MFENIGPRQAFNAVETYIPYDYCDRPFNDNRCIRYYLCGILVAEIVATDVALCNLILY